MGAYSLYTKLKQNNVISYIMVLVNKPHLAPIIS